MKQWVVAVTMCLGALLVATVVVVTTAQDDPEDASLAAVATQDDDTGPPGRERGERGDGKGPPPWAHGGEGSPPWAGKHSEKSWKPGKPPKEWKQRWRGLSEEQRADLMADLAREHAAGMRRWAECVADAGDRAARADCERPLPPGQAKKRPAP